MPYPLENPRANMILPFLAPFYDSFAIPFGWLLFRIVIGGGLIYEGWPKIIAPMAMSGYVESIGFAPGWFFSPALALVNFVGGICIVLGLLTRPFALANAFMLLVTLWFHAANPYGPTYLTTDGMAFLKNNLQYLTPAGQADLLKDGGAARLAQVQSKAITNSLFWAAGAALIAAIGGGWYSMDRFLKREF